MADITITTNKVMDTSAALANLAQILDTVQKSTDSFSKSLKEISAAISNATKLQTLFVAIEARKESYFVREVAMITAIDACATAEEVASIV